MLLIELFFCNAADDCRICNQVKLGKTRYKRLINMVGRCRLKIPFQQKNKNLNQVASTICILDFFVSFENMRISDPKTTFTNLKGCSIIDHPKNIT